jgi:hypothetical protein
MFFFEHSLSKMHFLERGFLILHLEVQEEGSTSSSILANILTRGQHAIQRGQKLKIIDRQISLKKTFFHCHVTTHSKRITVRGTGMPSCNSFFLKFNSWVGHLFRGGLTGTELVLSCVKKRHWAWTYTPPAASSSEFKGAYRYLRQAAAMLATERRCTVFAHIVNVTGRVCYLP